MRRKSIDALEMGNHSGLGAVPDRDTPNVDLDWSDFNAEVDAYDPTGVPAMAEASATNKTNWWDTFSNGLQTASDLISKYRNERVPGNPVVIPQDKPFNWTPIAIGGGALAALYLLTRSGKASK